MSTNLINFYEGRGTDSEGRLISEIWQFSSQELENVHDYIQWLFPLAEPSRFNDLAPIVTEQDIREFGINAIVQINLAKSFHMMLLFWGFTFGGREPYELTIPDHKPSWLEHGDHNLLRITRVLKSLNLLGASRLSISFMKVLEELYSIYPKEIGASIDFWRDAMKGA